MIKDIITDTDTLQKKSENASADDFYIVQDLIDTAEHHKEKCCGLAAIQLGYAKRICVIRNGESWLPIINPIYTKKSSEKITSVEGCMSLDGEREVRRHAQVMLIFSQTNGKIKKQLFGRQQAVIVQHEIDHMNGVLI